MLVVSYKLENDEKKSFFKRNAKILNLSAWGIILVVSTVGMAMFGLWLDRIFETQPMFMAGLMALANGCSVYRMYLESKSKK